MSTSFASGNTTTLDFARKTTPAYDKTLQFNRVIDQWDGKPESVIYSIDEQAILKTLKSDNLEDLHRITLAGQYIRSGVGIWDTLFNHANRQILSACVFTAQSNFTPIPRNRIVVASPFLNLHMPVSRVYLNQISQGDKIGIGINDITSGTIYVLLYTAQEQCSVPNKSQDDLVGFIPAVNIQLDHAFQIEHDNTVTIVNMDDAVDYDQEHAHPFVEWISNAVYNIREAYPWKPHFTPYVQSGFNRDEIEARLKKEHEQARDISWDDFQDHCRKIFESLKAKRPQHNRRRPGARDRQPQPRVPQIEVVSYNQDYITIRFDDPINPDGIVWKIARSEIDAIATSESFLTNKDLIISHIQESSQVFILTPSQFGDNAYLRYFNVNF